MAESPTENHMGESPSPDGMLQGDSALTQSRTEFLHEFTSERYKFILQQIHVTNENVYRFLAIYQTLMTVLVGAQISLFVWYKRWGLSAHTGRVGLVALLLLESMIACFTRLMVIIGTITWVDYRNEECDLTDRMVYVGFRERPKKKNFFRWYETYIALFVVLTIAIIWLLSFVFLLPNVH